MSGSVALRVNTNIDSAEADENFSKAWQEQREALNMSVGVVAKQVIFEASTPPDDYATAREIDYMIEAAGGSPGLLQRSGDGGC